MKTHPQVFKIAQAVNVPSEKSSLKRGMVLVVFTLLGGIVAVGFVLVWPLIENFRKG